MGRKKAAESDGKKIGSKGIQVHAGLTQFESRTVELSEETLRAISKLQGSGGKGSKASPADVIFSKVLPLLGKKVKVKTPPKKVAIELSLPLAHWRFFEAAESENGCDTDAVLSRILEDK